MSRDVVIIGSCGANLASLQFALQRLGVEAPVVRDPERALRASHVILPGVGAAAPAMKRLAEDGFLEVVPRLTQPVLGICLGMQLLFAASDEDDTECLGILVARVQLLAKGTSLPVPEMGWNALKIVGGESALTMRTSCTATPPHPAPIRARRRTMAGSSRRRSSTVISSALSSTPSARRRWGLAF
jgi:glutamine amidotransferase